MEGKRTVYNNTVWYTVIVELSDSTRIEQRDKITGETHKVVLTPCMECRLAHAFFYRDVQALCDTCGMKEE